MLNKLKKPLSAAVALIIIIMSVMPLAFAAPAYPEGVTKQQVSDSIVKLDTAVDSLVRGTQGKSLKELILPEIYSDKTLSALTVSIYKMIEENAAGISAIGLDVSVQGVASELSAYPEVQAKLSAYSAWSEASLEDVSWGVKTKEEFSLLFFNTL